jgi:putative oxidoreductase
MKRLGAWLVSARPLALDAGLLVLRAGIGVSVLSFHGWGKIVAGPDMWERVGGAMGGFGMPYFPTFWGFMAAISESACAALLAIGVLTRPAAALLGFTMLVAASHHVRLPPDQPGAGWNAASHAIELLVICVALLLTGPGRYSLGRVLERERVAGGAQT